MTVLNRSTYRIATVFAVLKEDVDVFHTGDIERQILRAYVMDEVVDGALNFPSLSVDGILEEVVVGIVEIMLVVVQKSLQGRT